MIAMIYPIPFDPQLLPAAPGERALALLSLGPDRGWSVTMEHGGKLLSIDQERELERRSKESLAIWEAEWQQVLASLPPELMQSAKELRAARASRHIYGVPAWVAAFACLSCVGVIMMIPIDPMFQFILAAALLWLLSFVGTQRWEARVSRLERQLRAG